MNKSPPHLLKMRCSFIGSPRLMSGLATKANDGEDRAANQGSGYEPGQTAQQDALGPFAENPPDNRPNNQKHSNGDCLVEVVLLSDIGDAPYLVRQEVVGGVWPATGRRRAWLVTRAALGRPGWNSRRDCFIHKLDVVIRTTVLLPRVHVRTR